MVGVIRDSELILLSFFFLSFPFYWSGISVISTLLDQLHLHRMSATHKLRTNLTYIDLHSQKAKRRRGEQEGTLSEEDEEAKRRKEKALAWGRRRSTSSMAEMLHWAIDQTLSMP